MGLDANGAALILECAREGVSFEQTLMIGRQNFFVGRSEWRQVLARAKAPTPPEWNDLDCFFGGYAEPFFKSVGAESVQSLDATDYEGADFIQDLNQPVPKERRESFDIVFDGGSLEHVFQFPSALLNCLQLVKPGGHFLAYTPANNYCGHGFYQFSPELVYRALNQEMGFKVKRLIAVEFGWRVRMFAINDPADVGSRISLMNRAQVLLFVCAQKTGPTPDSFGPVMQSDYSATWKSSADATPEREPVKNRQTSSAHRLLETAPRLARFLERAYHRWLDRQYQFSNHAAFTPHRPNY